MSKLGFTVYEVTGPDGPRRVTCEEFEEAIALGSAGRMSRGEPVRRRHAERIPLSELSDHLARCVDHEIRATMRLLPQKPTLAARFQDVSDVDFEILPPRPVKPVAAVENFGALLPRLVEKVCYTCARKVEMDRADYVCPQCRATHRHSEPGTAG